MQDTYELNKYVDEQNKILNTIRKEIYQQQLIDKNKTKN